MADAPRSTLSHPCTPLEVCAHAATDASGLVFPSTARAAAVLVPCVESCAAPCEGIGTIAMRVPAAHGVLPSTGLGKSEKARRTRRRRRGKNGRLGSCFGGARRSVIGEEGRGGRERGGGRCIEPGPPPSNERCAFGGRGRGERTAEGRADEGGGRKDCRKGARGEGNKRECEKEKYNRCECD